MENVFVVGAERSPMAFVPYPESGKTSASSISALRPEELAARVRDRMVEKTNLPVGCIERFNLGSVLSPRIEPTLFHAPAKTVARMPGSGQTCVVNASTIDRVCATGLAAVEDMHEEIQLGRVRLGLVVGLDMLSRGTKEEIDAVLTSPETGKTMAELADQTARKKRISRDELDLYAFQSFQCAHDHRDDQRSRIVPLSLPGNNFVLLYDEGSERVRPMKVLQKLGPLNGCERITKAHASKLADAASVVALASPSAVQEYGLRPLAKICAVESFSEADPEDFAESPNGAIALALARSGLSVGDIDHYVINEAFAPTPIHFMRTFGVPREKVNAWGGAIVFGHPFGATGVSLLVMLLTMLEREQKRFGIVAVCAAGGDATACVIERTV